MYVTQKGTLLLSSTLRVTVNNSSSICPPLSWFLTRPDTCGQATSTKEGLIAAVADVHLMRVSNVAEPEQLPSCNKQVAPKA